MFAITIVMSECPVPWMLLFNVQEHADIAWNAYRFCDQNVEISLEDDFGQTVVVRRSLVAGAMFEDMNKSMLAHIERGLHNARTQAKAEQMGRNDPVLKTAAMAGGQGPAIYSPMGNGRG